MVSSFSVYVHVLGIHQATILSQMSFGRIVVGVNLLKGANCNFLCEVTANNSFIFYQCPLDSTSPTRDGDVGTHKKLGFSMSFRYAVHLYQLS